MTNLEQLTQEQIIKAFAASIDRIDSKGNYTSDNVQLVCAGVNLVKQEMPQNTFIQFCRKVVEHQIKRMDDLESMLETDSNSQQSSDKVENVA